jgi:hypothetical protein
MTVALVKVRAALRAQAATPFAAQPRHRKRKFYLFTDEVVNVYDFILVKGYGEVIVAKLFFFRGLCRRHVEQVETLIDRHSQRLQAPVAIYLDGSLKIADQPDFVARAGGLKIKL